MFILSSDIFSHLLLSSIYLTSTSFPFSLSGHPSSSFVVEAVGVPGRCSKPLEQLCLKKLHRHRPQIASTHPNCQKNKTRKELSTCDHEERQAWETRRQRQPRAAENGDHEGRQAWETRRQRQPRAAQNGDHEERQAWETRRQRQPRAAQNGDHEGRQAWEARRQREQRVD